MYTHVNVQIELVLLVPTPQGVFDVATSLVTKVARISVVQDD